MKNYNNLSKCEKENIKELYYKMIPLDEISTMLSVSKRSVPRVLKDFGINTRLKNRYTLNESFFQKIDSEEKAYWLGFLYADGYVGDSKHNNISITLMEADKEHLYNFAKSINYSGGIRDSGFGGFPGSGKRFTINFSSKKMAEDLRKLGLYPGKSTTMKLIPPIEEELTKHFIRGYFDGDGSIYSSRTKTKYKDKVYYYKTPSVSIVGTYYFLLNLNSLMSTEFKFKKSKSEYMYYMYCDGKKNVLSFYNEVYSNSNIYLLRKNEKFKTIFGPNIK